MYHAETTSLVSFRSYHLFFRSPSSLAPLFRLSPFHPPSVHTTSRPASGPIGNQPPLFFFVFFQTVLNWPPFFCGLSLLDCSFLHQQREPLNQPPRMSNHHCQMYSISSNRRAGVFCFFLFLLSKHT